MTTGSSAPLPVEGQSDWWNAFYATRSKPCPFFVEWPDESLAQWVDDGTLVPGKAMDLGCGAARNAIFLARRGFAVDAIDYSHTAIDWAEERVRDAGVDVRLQCRSVFEITVEPGTFDVVYDAGCFHHMPPNLRRAYVDLVTTALKLGGFLGLTCFRPEGGSGFTDDEAIDRGSVGGGLGYTEGRLREIWSPGLEVRAIRQMQKPSPGSALFGEDFLWVMLARKR